MVSATMLAQASPATETKPKPGPSDSKTKPNSRVPGTQQPPHGGPLFEEARPHFGFENLGWNAPSTLRTGDERCPDPLIKISVCTFDDDLAFIGIPLDLGVFYPSVWPFFRS